MPLSYRNLLDANALADAIKTGDFNNKNNPILKDQKSSVKYIKGYAQDSAIEALANALNINKGLFRQIFGLEDKQLDAYDPYHTQDAKVEDFWNLDGKVVQAQYDEDTNTFKRGLYSDFGFRDQDFWYEDPFLPTFELFFNDESPFFKGDSNIGERVDPNCLKYFIQKYQEIDPDGYFNRFEFWNEFKAVFFKIFQNDLKSGANRNTKNKAYYISKITGLQNLNKKIINYAPDGDKISITISEDVSMLAWYLAELYNNIAYSYRNQRYAFPENLLRFDMIIKINDIRNFTLPRNTSQSSSTAPVDRTNIKNKEIENYISPKSQIVYTLHDCNFNFFESRNYPEELEIGGWGIAAQNNPQSLTFDIYYKSVTRWSEFPLFDGFPINPWEKFLFNTETTYQSKYFQDLERYKEISGSTKGTGYLNQMLAKSTQNVVNLGLNYMDNLETKLREVRGGVVNDLLNQFRDKININKIEPDNVYAPDFNDRTSLKNFGRQVGSSILNDLESGIRNATNF